MKLANILGTVALLCCLSVSAFAAVQQGDVLEQRKKGMFEGWVPRIMLKTSAARAAADENVQALLDKFRYFSDRRGNTGVDYRVTADNDSYVSFIMKSITMVRDTPYVDRALHALVVDAQTGEKLPLENFVRIPGAKYLREQVKSGNVKVMFLDGKEELAGFSVDGLSKVPEEFVVDEGGNVSLVAEEITDYYTGTPLLFLPRSSVPDIYVNKG